MFFVRRIDRETETPSDQGSSSPRSSSARYLPSAFITYSCICLSSPWFPPNVSFLGSFQCNAALVCRQWFALACSDHLWKSLYATRFHLMSQPISSCGDLSSPFRNLIPRPFGEPQLSWKQSYSAVLRRIDDLEYALPDGMDECLKCEHRANLHLSFRHLQYALIHYDRAIEHYEHKPKKHRRIDISLLYVKRASLKRMLGSFECFADLASAIALNCEKAGAIMIKMTLSTYFLRFLPRACLLVQTRWRT